MEASMAALVSELGYPWYVGMLADEDVATVRDVLVKVGLHRAEEERSRDPDSAKTRSAADAEAAFHRSQRSPSATSLSSAGDEPTTRADRLMFVSAYLVSLGFAESHAGEISEEVVSKHDDACVPRARVLSEDRLFQFDTLDCNEEEKMPSEDSESEEEQEPRRGPSEEERRTVRAAIEASKARVAKSRRASRVSRSSRDASPASTREKQSRESSGRSMSLDYAVVSPPYPNGPRTIPHRKGSNDSSLSLRREDGSLDEDEFDASSTQERVRRGAAGGVYDPTFLRLVKPLYDLHMGAENLGPMLYNLARFTKPARILEVGAGYTSAFLLQALNDNAAELETYRDLRRSGLAVCGDAPWSVEAFFDREAGDGGGRYNAGKTDVSEYDRVTSGVLHCIDNLAHEHTTAHVVMETARKMRCGERLRLHEADAFDPDLPSTLEAGIEFDMLWIDLGAAHRIEGFFEAWWPRVRAEGGMVIVHSTLTNALSRGWLERMRDLARAPDTKNPYGRFETMSLLEPHKMFQNSVTMFQKRGGAFGRYDEPVHTKFP
jgi:predicted O-methyltransferase YrrM